MTVRWIEFPRPGTTVLDGRWMVTVWNDAGNFVTFADFKHGRWLDDHGEELDGIVIAIAHAPKPYVEPEPSEIGDPCE